MHGPALSGTKRRASAGGRTAGTGTLENRLSGYGTPRRGTNRRSGSSLRRSRRLVYRARSRLRHDHARRRLRGPGRDRHPRTNHGCGRLAGCRRRCRTRWSRRNAGCRGGGNWRLRGNRRGLRLRRRWLRRNHVHRTRPGLRQNDARCWHGRSYRNLGSGGWLCFDWRRSHDRTRHRGWWSRRGRRLLLADDGLQDIAGLGYMRKIDLGLDFIWLDAAGAGAFAGHLRFTGRAEMCAYLCCFVFFDGTGMCLLLSHPHRNQCVENGLAFDFQLSSQIVDSNLAHPPYFSSRTVPLSLHSNLTESVPQCSRCESHKTNLLCRDVAKHVSAQFVPGTRRSGATSLHHLLFFLFRAGFFRGSGFGCDFFRRRFLSCIFRRRNFYRFSSLFDC